MREAASSLPSLRMRVTRNTALMLAPAVIASVAVLSLLNFALTLHPPVPSPVRVAMSVNVPPSPSGVICANGLVVVSGGAAGQGYLHLGSS